MGECATLLDVGQWTLRDGHEVQTRLQSTIKRLLKITIEGVKNTGIWKAARGCWDGSKKSDGNSVCEYVIRAGTRKSWIAIMQNRLPAESMHGHDGGNFRRQFVASMSASIICWKITELRHKNGDVSDMLNARCEQHDLICCRMWHAVSPSRKRRGVRRPSLCFQTVVQNPGFGICFQHP